MIYRPLNVDVKSISFPLCDNLYFFQRRTGLAEHVDVDRDALKKSLKRSKKVKSQDAMSIDSWTSNASKGESTL